MILYRYFDSDGALSTLRTGKIRASNASVFNDPFELEIRIPKRTEEQLRQVYLHPANIEQFWAGQQATRPIPRAEFDAAYLKKVPLWIADNLKDQESGDPIVKQGTYRKRITQDWYLISTSQVRDNILMWSHYTGKHQGAVIGIDTQSLPECVHDVVEVVYQEGLPIFPIGEEALRDCALAAVRTKALQWAYEQEVRIIVTIPPKHAEPFFDVPFDPRMISSVTVGIRAESQFKADLAHLLEEDRYKNVTREHASPSHASYAIDIIDGF